MQLFLLNLKYYEKNCRFHLFVSINDYEYSDLSFFAVNG